MPTLLIGGMNCEHCRKAVLQAVRGLPGVNEPQVDLLKGTLTWQDQGSDTEHVKRAVVNAGYGVKGEEAS